MKTKIIKRTNNRSRRGPQDPRAVRSNTRAAVETYAGDAYSLASRTWRGLNELRRLVNIETKYVDVIGSITPSQSGGIAALHLLAQGVTENTRVGNSIKVHRFSFKAVLAMSSSTTQASTYRVLIVRDMENNGVTPTGADVLESAGTADAPKSHPNFDNKKRFSLIFDELFQLNVASNATALINFEIPLEKHIDYRGTTAASGSNAEGSMFCLIFTNEASNVGSFSVASRIEYTDD